MTTNLHQMVRFGKFCKNGREVVHPKRGLLTMFGGDLPGMKMANVVTKKYCLFENINQY